MATIKPFQPYRYTPKAGDPSKLLTQPYDKIDAEMQARYLAASPYNLVRIILGEKRLSDFLLWECAYAELVFTRRMWPDFDAADLAAAVREFRGRQRRFGGLPEAPVNGHARRYRESAWLD